jgi:hypothetical protein
LQSASDGAPEEGTTSPESDQGNQSTGSSDISTKQLSSKQEDADSHNSAPSYPASSKVDSEKSGNKVNFGPDNSRHKLYSQRASSSGQRDSHHSKGTAPLNPAKIDSYSPPVTLGSSQPAKHLSHSRSKSVPPQLLTTTSLASQLRKVTPPNPAEVFDNSPYSPTNPPPTPRAPNTPRRKRVGTLI